MSNRPGDERAKKEELPSLPVRVGQDIWMNSGAKISELEQGEVVRSKKVICDPISERLGGGEPESCRVLLNVLCVEPDQGLLNLSMLL